MVFDEQVFLNAGFDLQKEIPLSKLGTFQLGGPVKWLIHCTHPEDLGKLCKLCHQYHYQAILIGEGSNLLFSDNGWSGLIIRYVSDRPQPVSTGPHIWRFNAAVNLQKLVEWSLTEGWSGLEAFSGIPGTLGGAVVGNAGAWGVQMEHVLEEVCGFDSSGNLCKLKVDDCGFSYRDSRLKHENFWVSEVSLHLQPGVKNELMEENRRILEMRAARHPDWERQPCIGSFFKNLEPSSAAERRQAAGYFLEQAGAKDQKVGGAGVYNGHANILIKEAESCTADDIAKLARKLQISVQEMHGIDLIREVRYLGEIEGEIHGTGFY